MQILAILFLLLIWPATASQVMRHPHATSMITVMLSNYSGTLTSQYSLNILSEYCPL